MTVEAWARAFVLTTDLERKFDASSVPSEWAAEGAAAVRIERPGRPASLRVAPFAPKPMGRDAMRAPEKRAELVHTFLHHELQAAELFAWALLAFPSAPVAFRKGLLGVLRDEVRHMALYRTELARLGFAFGDFAVRDWFWERVPSASSPAHFVAVLGIGFEGGNLDHAARFAARFRSAGDEALAAVQETVAREEIAHARFAVGWFRRFTGGEERDLDFASWTAHLPPPLSALVMRGSPMNRKDREKAGFPKTFLDELERWAPR